MDIFNLSNKNAPHNRRQICSCSSNMIGSIGYGFLAAYTINSVKSVNDISRKEVLPVILYTPVIGALCGATVMHYFGRKTSLVLSHILALIGLICMLTNHFLVFRIGLTMVAFANGFHITTSRVYIVEICGPKLRTFIHFFTFIGNSLGWMIHNSLKMWHIQIILSVSPFLIAIFSLLLAFRALETPYWLMATEQTQVATENFYWLRGPDAYEREFNLMISNKAQFQKGLWRNIFSVKFLKVFFMLSVLFIVANAICSSELRILVTDATGTITDHMDDSITHMSMYITSIISGLLVCILVFVLNRKFLYLLSTAGMVMSLAAVCAVIFLYSYKKTMLIIPFYLCVWFLFMGVKQFPWLIAAEEFPAVVRDIGMGLITVYDLMVYVNIYRVSSFLKKYDKENYELIEFSMSAIISLGGLILTYFIMPETKDKALEYNGKYFIMQRKTNLEK